MDATERRLKAKMRQNAFKQRMKAKGYARVGGWVLQAAAGDVQHLIDRLNQDPDLSVGPVRRLSTGKLEKL